MSSGRQTRFPPGHHLHKKDQQQKYNLRSAQSTSSQKQSFNNTTSHMEHYLQLTNNWGENLCFVNTCLQLLRSIGIFCTFFSSKVWIDHPHRRILAPILTQIELIFSSEEASADTLRQLVATASGNVDMASGAQQDMEEFLNLMLIEIGYELDTLNLSDTVLDNLKSRDKIVKKFLHGREAGVCPNCHHVPAEKYDNFTILRLPVPSRVLPRSNKFASLSSLISKHYSEEVQPEMKCPNCCKHESKCPLTGNCTPMSYTEQRVLIKSPNILVVQLLRFNATKKILTKVIPEDILVLPNGDRYKLVSIADHIGQSPSAGHYVLQFQGMNEWSTCDDTRQYISKQPFSANNYLFAYKKLQNESHILVPTFPQSKKTTATPMKPPMPQPKMPTATRVKTTVPKGKTGNVPKGKTGNVQDENIFNVLKQDVMDRCKVCKQDLKHILIHLRWSPKCKEQYNVDLLKKEKKEEHKQYMKNYMNEMRDNEREKDEGAFKRDIAEEKSKQREDKRNKDEGAFKRDIAEEKSKQRKDKRKKDEDAFKRDRADEQRKTRDNKKEGKNALESHRRRIFFDAIRDGPIYACVCCRRIRFRKQVKVFNSDEITEKSPIEDIVEEAIGNPPENMRVKGKFYICNDCLLKVSKGKVPSMSHKNGLDLVSLEGRDELKLTELENVLIAKNILFQMFVQLPKSRWTATKKQMVSIPIFDRDIVNTLQSLPRTPSDAGIVKVQLKRKKSMKNTHLEMFISPKKLRDALKTLKQLGNKHYQFEEFNVDFEEIWRRNDPEGYEMVFGEKADDNIESNSDENTESDDENTDSEEEKLQTEYTEGDSIQKWKFNFDSTTTFVNDFPELDVRENDTENNENFPNTPVVLAPGEGKIPTNILDEKDWDLKSFPGLYPDGRMGLHEEREVRLSMQQYFQQRILNFDRRFANTPSFVFSAFACNEKNQLERNINISYLRGTKQADGKYSLNDHYSVLDNMPGTPRYWQKKKYELISRIENLGPFHLFFTLSSAEKRYNENFTTFLQEHDVRYVIENGIECCTVDGIPLDDFLQREENLNKHEFIRKNILTATLNFNHRVEEFIKNIVMNKSGEFCVDYYNYRVEFQLRGKFFFN